MIILGSTCDADCERSSASVEPTREQLSHDACSDGDLPRRAHSTTVDVVDHDDVVRARRRARQVADVAERRVEVVAAVDERQVAGACRAGQASWHRVPRVTQLDAQSSREPGLQERQHRPHVGMSADVERLDHDVTTGRQEVEAAVTRVETCLNHRHHVSLTATVILFDILG